MSWSTGSCRQQARKASKPGETGASARSANASLCRWPSIRVRIMPASASWFYGSDASTREKMASADATFALRTK